MPADNEQFATSGGATRPSGGAEQHLLALVRALPIPPPDAKLLKRFALCREPNELRELKI